jgi:sorting nexin-8
MNDPPSARSRQSRESLGGLEADPWGSPQLHRGHNHAQTEREPPVLNGFGSVRSATNAWSSRAGEDETQHGVPSGPRANGRTDGVPSTSSGSGWGESYGNTTAGDSFGGPVRAGLGNLGAPSSGQEESNARRPSGIGISTSSQVEETVTVNLLPEKEGMFMFQHRNYEVKSARRGSTVIRRYSDFVWLLDCLQKRYPFRQLPLLPPKRISGTSEHRLATSSPRSLLTSFRLKSMALTFQRIQTRSLRSGAEGSCGSPTHLFVILF